MEGFLLFLLFLALIAILALPFQVAAMSRRLGKLEKAIESLRTRRATRTLEDDPQPVPPGAAPGAVPNIPAETPWESWILNLPGDEPSPAESEAPAGAPVAADPLPGDAAPPKSTPEAKPAGRTLGWRGAPQRTSPSWADLEATIGKKWLVWAGALALLLGTGFLYRWAVEQGLLSYRHRLISGTIAGVALWALAMRFRKLQYGSLVAGFFGAGSAVLYMTVFAAQAWWGILSPAFAWTALAAITGLTALAAVILDFQSLVLMAQLGGFLAPVLLRNPDAHPRILFVYMLLLNAGLIAGWVVRRWSAVLGVSAVATAWLLWPQRTTVPPWEFVGWISAIAVLFQGAPLGAAWTSRQNLSLRELAFLTTNGLGWLGASWAMLGRDLWLGAIAAAVGLGHLTLGQAWTRRFPAHQRTADTLSGLGASLLALCLPMILDARALTVTLGAVACAFLIMGAPRLRLAFAVGVAAMFAALLRVGKENLGWNMMEQRLRTPPSHEPLFFNPDVVTAFAVLAGMAAVGWFRSHIRVQIATLALVGLTVVVGTEAALVVDRWGGDSHRTAHLRIVWSLLTLAAAHGVLWMTARWRRPEESAVAVLLVGVSLTLGLNAVAALAPVPFPFIVNPRFALLALLPFSFIVTVPLLVHRQQIAPGSAAVFTKTSVVTGASFLLMLLSTELLLAYQPLGSQASQAALSVTWTVFSIGLLTVGILRRSPGARRVALGLFATTLLKVAIVDLSRLQQLPRILSFLVLGVVLMVCAWLYHRFERRMFGRAHGDSATEPPTPGEPS